MIRLQGVSLAYAGETVLQNLTLTIPEGGRVALMGESGCGKTTLLRYLAGLLPAESGEAVGLGQKAAFVFQEDRLLPWRTAAENVNLVLGDKKSTLPLAEEWLARLGLKGSEGKYPAALSGGMSRRVNLARALAAGGGLLLLDEPFQGLDEARWEELAGLLRELTVGKTLILATHDRREAESLCCEIWQYRNKGFYPEE